MEEILLFYDMEDLIVTATKHPQKITDAPAIATVISGDEIRKMGARNLLDILRRVPGLGTTYSYISRQQVEIRGIKTYPSETVKVLIDGHSVNTNTTGGFDYFWRRLSVDSIKRIEIVRGPGSALYGSNAVSGVINIITKESYDIDGILFSVGGGSFDSRKIDLQAAKKFDNVDAVFFLNSLKTDGARLYVHEDITSTNGYTDSDDKYIDASLKLRMGNFSLKSRIINGEQGPYLGVTKALNDESVMYTDKLFVELSYDGEITDSSSYIVKSYMDEFKFKAHWEMYPENFTGTWGTTYPDGMLAEPSLKERIYGLEIQVDHDLSEDNKLTFGVLTEKRKQFDVTVSFNYEANDEFDLLDLPFLPPYSSLVDFSDNLNWSEETNRYVRAAYIQDVWDVQENISLTAGVRYDDYSDFGNSTNPRAAAVWHFKEHWDLKLLYGEAFRAPSFEELHLKNNPSIEGNSGLKAEEMTTYELSLGHQYEQGSGTRVTFFENSFKNKIDDAEPVGSKYKYINVDGIKVRGLEAEWDWAFSKENIVYFNYTYQKAKDRATGNHIAEIADHKGNMGFNMKVSDHFNLNSNVFMVGKKRRAFGDDRRELAGYSIVDMTLIAKDFYETLEIRTSVHNLLDKNYSDPSADPSIAGGIPGDFPREGINFMLEAQYTF